MKKANIISACAAVLLSIANVSAGIITLTPAAPALSGAPGDTVQVIVDLSNTAATTQFLNGISTSGLGALGSTPFDTTPFFTDASVPFFLDPLGSPGADAFAAHIFDILIPLGTTPGTYNGGFTITGGDDGSQQNTLATALLTLQVTGSAAVPEPSTIGFVAAGAVIIGLRKRRS